MPHTPLEDVAAKIDRHLAAAEQRRLGTLTDLAMAGNDTPDLRRLDAADLRELAGLPAIGMVGMRAICPDGSVRWWPLCADLGRLLLASEPAVIH